MIRVLMALALAGLVALAACGGDGDDEDGFVADANAICHDAATQVADVWADTGQIESGEEFVEQVEGVSEVEDQKIPELRALEPPEEDADRFQEYLSLIEQAAALRDEAIAAGEQDDQQRLGAVSEERRDLQEQASDAAADIGLEDCDEALSDEAEQEIGAVIERSASAPGEEACEDTYTGSFLEDSYGGDLESCAEQSPEAESVEVGELSGVDEAYARATAELTGGNLAEPTEGSPDVQTFGLALVHEDGSWRIASIGPSE